MVNTIASWLLLAALFAPPLSIVAGVIWLVMGKRTRRVEPSGIGVVAPAHR